MTKDAFKKAEGLVRYIECLENRLARVEAKGYSTEKVYFDADVVDKRYNCLTEEAVDKIILIAKEDLESQLAKYKKEFDGLWEVTLVTVPDAIPAFPNYEINGR